LPAKRQTLNAENREVFSVIVTEDGSLTLLHPIFGEAYSSKHGAWMQARELYLKLTQTHLHPNPRVLEIGFGLGVNFRTTLQNTMERGVKLEYLSYELFPVDRSLLESVEVPLGVAEKIWSELFVRWPYPLPSTAHPLSLSGDWGSLEICFGDVTKTDFPLNWASAIYLDPFSPRVNPEPWRPEVLKKLYQSAQAGAYLATYSVAGQFRRDLGRAGFEAVRVPGVGKRAWTLGQKPLTPLPKEGIER